MAGELYPGAGAGFRAFRLLGGRLYSLTARDPALGHHEWRLDRANVAACEPAPFAWVVEPLEHVHRAPMRRCNCGFNFYKDLAGVLAEPIAYPQNDEWVHTYIKGVPVVICLCAAWGRVVEHRIGFRTEFAIPLAVVPVEGRVVDMYTDRPTDVPHMFPAVNMGLPVLTAETAYDYARERGLTLLDRREPEPLNTLHSPAWLSRPRQGVTSRHIKQNAVGGMQLRTNSVGTGPPTVTVSVKASPIMRELEAMREAFEMMARSLAPTLREAAEALGALHGVLYTPPAAPPTCCGEPDHGPSWWCRRAFRRFFWPRRLAGAIERAAFARALGNRYPWLRGFMRGRGRA